MYWEINLFTVLLACLVTQLCPTLCDWIVARQAPLSMGFPRQENFGVGCHFLLWSYSVT